MQNRFGPEILAASHQTSNERHRTTNITLSRERTKGEKDSKVNYLSNMFLVVAYARCIKSQSQSGHR